MVTKDQLREKIIELKQDRQDLLDGYKMLETFFTSERMKHMAKSMRIIIDAYEKKG